MNVTEVRINMVDRDGALRAYADIVLDGVFAVKNLAVLEYEDGYRVKMPRRENHKEPKDSKKRWVDICHPINNDTRLMIENAVLDEYEKHIPTQHDA